MSFGNMPNDDGNLLFTEFEKNEFVSLEPDSIKYFKELISGREFLHGEKRYCLWLKDILPNELRQMSKVLERVQNIKAYRSKSTREATRKLALYPTLFGEIRQPENGTYVLIPRVSSENRDYIPMGFFDFSQIVSDTCLFIPDASLFHFGILTSKMHMAWVKIVCGRLKSDFRYSKDIVYNNFPFPSQSGDTVVAVTKVEQLAQSVLDVRLKYSGSSLADLYDPLTMPPDLAKAHADLDRAVEKLYLENSPLEGWTRSGRGGFTSDEERVAFLFEMYEKIVSKK